MMPYLSNKPVVVFDLDDTLYKEIDYLYSAYREIADFLWNKRYVPEDPFPMMIEWYRQGKNVFQSLNGYYGLVIPLELYLTLYRNHIPDITLDVETARLLEHLSRLDYQLGIISDGRSITQRNKIASLGLARFMQDGCIVISEEIGSEKPNEANYWAIQHRFSHRQFIYVGDNPAKDFVTPNRLGWHTLCLLDDGRNIHRQDFSLPKRYLPHATVDTIYRIFQHL